MAARASPLCGGQGVRDRTGGRERALPSRGIRGSPGETGRGTAPPQGLSKKPKKAAATGEGTSASDTARHGGFRVFKVSVGDERPRLKLLYRRIVFAALSVEDPEDTDVMVMRSGLPKEYFYYIKGWRNKYEAVLEAREKANKSRPPNRLPPLELLLRFVVYLEREGKREVMMKHGTGSAKCVIALYVKEKEVTGVLKMHAFGKPLVAIKLDKWITEALLNELQLDYAPEFVLTLTCEGKLRIIAMRSPWPWYLFKEESTDFTVVRIRPPYRVIGVDINSRYGMTVIVADVTEEGAKVVLVTRLSPPNMAYFKDHVKILNKIIAGKKIEERELENIKEMFKNIILTPEWASKKRKELYYTMRKLRKEWVKEVKGLFRKLMREAGNRAILVVDPPDYKSLQRTPLQETLLGITKDLENLAKYEGARYTELRVSGKRCPLCRERGVQVGHRYYRCPTCNLVWDRDYCASFRAASCFAPALREWLRNHLRALAPNYREEHNSSRKNLPKKHYNHDAHSCKPLQLKAM